MFSQKPFNGESLPPRTLSLTFDDGPGPQTLEIAHYLAEKRIQAAFFLVGKHMREFPDTAERLRKLGHTVANHTFHHVHLTNSFSSIPDLIREVELTDVELQPNGSEVCGPTFFRPPYGAWSPRLAFLFNTMGKRHDQIGPVNWNIGGKDFYYWERGETPTRCAEYYKHSINRARERSGIVLFHDRRADSPPAGYKIRTAETVLQLIPSLLNQGFKFVGLPSVPELQRATPQRVALRETNWLPS